MMQYPRIIIFYLVFIFITALVTFADANGDNSLATIFKRAVSELKIPGAVMIVRSPIGKEHVFVSGVKVIRKNSTNPQNNIMSSNLKFRIGSITKTYIASIMLMLVYEGRVGLDTTVHAIYPGLVQNDRTITIRQLLMMRSGLSNFSADLNFLKKFREQPWYVWSTEELLSYCTKTTAQFAIESKLQLNNVCVIPAPSSGNDFEYNNTNFVVLGMLIEKLTNDKIENQIYSRILKPLKLKYTSFPAATSAMHEPYAKGYDFNPTTNKVSNLSQKINPSWAWSSANGVSTAKDVMKWLIAYLDGFGLDDKLLAEQRKFATTDYAGISYGLGLMNKYGAVGHNGNFAGIYTAIAYKFRGYYFVILTNGQSYGGGRRSSAESVFWKIVREAAFFKN